MSIDERILFWFQPIHRWSLIIDSITPIDGRVLYHRTRENPHESSQEVITKLSTKRTFKACPSRFRACPHRFRVCPHKFSHKDQEKTGDLTPPPIFSYSLWPNTFSGPVPAGCNKITTDRWAFPLFSATYLSLPSPAHASSGEDMEICLRRQRKSLLVDELEEQRNHFGKAPLSHARLDTGISTAFSHVDDFIF